jgi:ribosomal protein S18 acetylase RimI-like enzyme
MCLFVAVAAGYVVGTVGCQALGNGEGHLRGMAVLPEWQAKGVAKALLAAAETELRRRQCRRITLDTTEPLQRAVRFYRKHGFSASGRVSDFFGMRLHEYIKLL